jgi:hypothetical protein
MQLPFTAMVLNSAALQLNFARLQLNPAPTNQILAEASK